MKNFPNMSELKPGIYRHYKGGQYRLLAVAEHSETKEPQAVYQDLADPSLVWARPLAMFQETVELDGQKKPRFEFVAPAEERHPEAVVGPLIYNQAGQFLLIKNPKFGDYWTIPGGHIELNEKAEEALIREIKEETGLEMKNIEPIGFDENINPSEFHEPKHFIYLNYLAELAGGELTPSREMTEHLWASLEDVPKLKIMGSVLPLIDAYRQRISGQALDSWENKYKRALADYQNLLKQTVRDKEDFVKYALGEFLEEILPVYDHLKLSLAGLDEKASENPWVQGVRHVLKQFREVLSSHGLEEIKAVGGKFDHNLMEAVSGSGEMVAQEIMPGYVLNGRVLRPAKVIVGQDKDLENK